jgi:hypothetical protein
VEISTSKSDCTENCSRSNCGFLVDVGLNNSDANMVCVPVDDLRSAFARKYLSHSLCPLEALTLPFPPSPLQATRAQAKTRARGGGAVLFLFFAFLFLFFSFSSI